MTVDGRMFYFTGASTLKVHYLFFAVAVYLWRYATRKQYLDSLLCGIISTVNTAVWRPYDGSYISLSASRWRWRALCLHFSCGQSLQRAVRWMRQLLLQILLLFWHRAATNHAFLSSYFFCSHFPKTILDSNILISLRKKESVVSLTSPWKFS